VAKSFAVLLYAAASDNNAINAQTTKDWLTLILTTTSEKRQNPADHLFFAYHSTRNITRCPWTDLADSSSLDMQQTRAKDKPSKEQPEGRDRPAESSAGRRQGRESGPAYWAGAGMVRVLPNCS
jgi:hypothetical protein